MGDIRGGSNGVLRNINVNQTNRGSVSGVKVSSPLILEGRKFIELPDTRSFNRSSPVTSQTVLSQQDLNFSTPAALRGYSPGPPQPGLQVQTLPRNQADSPNLNTDFSHQTLPSRYSQTMQNSQNRTQMIGRGNSLSQQNINQQILQQKVAQQQLAKQQLLNKNHQQLTENTGQLSASAQLYQQQQLMSKKYQQAALQHQQQQQQLQQQQQQAALQQQQAAIQQQQQQAVIQQQQQQQAVIQQQQAAAIKQQKQIKQQQEQQAVEKLLEQQRAHEAEQRQRQIQEKMAALSVNNQQEGDRTYMNVQPVAVAGRGGRILSPGELQNNINNKAGGGGKKVPAIPKSQEVKHKKEPLYSTPLQFPGSDSTKSMFEEGVYANYAPASLYSNYSNYSELEVLRSTDSQYDDEQPTVGLPNLGDSPVSSSYSELRQANIQPLPPQQTHNTDGSIYEPVLPPKGVPGPNSIHYKSLSSGSTDSDYFGSCVQCGAKIIGEGTGCSAMGRLYHIQCFTCAECGRQLQGLPFYPVEGLPLCEADYTNTLEKCCKCFQPILERILRATGKPYHPSCFTCVACNKSLDGIPFTVDATNQIHCIEDFHRRFAPRCSVCQDPIMPTPGQEETVRVVALDRSFHLQCYRCVDCNLVLSSEEEGRGCYPLDNTVLCRGCNTRRIQTLTSTIASD